MTKKQTAADKKKAETDRDPLDTIFEKMSTEYNIPGSEIPTILRNTAFKVEADETPATTSEMKALLSVAEKYKLNPFIREIFAFRNKKGVLVPVVSVDGWIKILNSREKLDGYKFIYSEKMTTIGDSKECFEWIEIEIHRPDRKFPVTIREYLDECYVSRKFTNPWTTHTKRMLRHKTLSQGVRVAFGVNDVQDLDEVQRIDDALEAELDREKELEKPETADEIVQEPEKVAPPPKVLNEIKQETEVGTGDEGVPDMPVVQIPPPPPEKKEETEIKEPTSDDAHGDIFTDAKTESEEKEEIPDLF